MDPASVSFGLAFVAGLASFLSPCVLPLVPVYLAFVTGLSAEELARGDRGTRRRAAARTSLFVLGFATIFVGLGAAATALGELLLRGLPLLRQVGGGIVVVFGLVLLGVVRTPALLHERRLALAAGPARGVGAYLAGVAFGAGWTPCIGPVLGSILLYSSLTETATRGTLLLATYSAGLGLPFLAAGLALDRYLERVPALRRWSMPLERAAGAVLVLVGILLVTGTFTTLTAFLAKYGLFFDLEI